MSKKGFTLIEIAIVLVIVGLMATLALKGNDLMDQVTWKRDVQSYEHLQAAILLFRDTRGHMPGDENGNGVIEGNETYPAYVELRDTAGLDKGDFTFKTDGPMYFLFTECAKDNDSYIVDNSKFTNYDGVGTCIFPSEFKPWEMEGKGPNDIYSMTNTEQMICMYEVGFDDKNVFTGNIRMPSEGVTINQDNLNGAMADMDSPFDCFSSDLKDEPTGAWQDVVVIGLW